MLNNTTFSFYGCQINKITGTLPEKGFWYKKEDVRFSVGLLNYNYFFGQSYPIIAIKQSIICTPYEATMSDIIIQLQKNYITNFEESLAKVCNTTTMQLRCYFNNILHKYIKLHKLVTVKNSSYGVCGWHNNQNTLFLVQKAA